MRISELICFLQEVKCHCGDVPIAVFGIDGNLKDADSQTFETNGYTDGLKYKEQYLYLI